MKNRTTVPTYARAKLPEAARITPKRMKAKTMVIQFGFTEPSSYSNAINGQTMDQRPHSRLLPPAAKMFSFFFFMLNDFVGY